ncbi:MAG: DnaD domain protein [bacterium]|nr:DnaD domain protein [bacterium]
MGDLRNSFITKDFVVNSNIIKCISNLDINLDEFLLLLYFINVSVDLDSDSIKEKLGFDDDKISSVFSSLLNKKYIEMKVTKIGGKIQEQINLNPFYDRLALNKKTEDKSTDIFALFESELGRTLSSFEYDLINKWLENGNSENTIKEALKEAILNGVTNFKYIDKIIYEWSKKNVKSRIIEEKETTEMFDYDWLDDNE